MLKRSRICAMQSRQLDLLGGVHARGGLVEQQQLRLRGQRAHDLQPALVAVRQASCRLVAPGGPGRRSRAARACGRRCSLSSAWKPGQPQQRVKPNACCRWRWKATRTLSTTDSDGNRRMFWKVRAMPRRGDLRRAGSPTSDSPAKRMSPDGGPVHAGDQVEDAGLARAVRADEADQRALARRRSERSPTAVRPPKRSVQWSSSSSGAAMLRPCPRAAFRRNRPCGRRIISRMISSE